MNLSNTIDLATCRGPMQPPYPSPLRWALTSAFGTAPGLRGPPGAREWRAAYRNENRPPEWTRIAREQGQNGSPRGKQLPAMSPGAVGGRWLAWNGNSPELPISVAGLISDAGGSPGSWGGTLAGCRVGCGCRLWQWQDPGLSQTKSL